ncbi:MAG: adenine deaminase [Bacillaceae bacterium]|nr:adenine deaminase [Bacillaceae bacterium]
MEVPVRPMDKHKMRRLIETARFQRAATTWIRNGNVLNIYTGETLAVNVVIYEDRIAYVGEKEPLTDEHTVVIDADGQVLVPGYIEPHAHPYQLYHFSTLGQYALTRGTTTLIIDNLSFYLMMEPDRLEQLVKETEHYPVKYFWWLSLDPHNNLPEMMAKYHPEKLERFVRMPHFLQAGELTAWPALLEGEDPVFSSVHLARSHGKRIEGHLPGASAETLNAVSAAGITACHESITSDEVIRRLRLGLYATLRHSSIRRDVPELVRGLVEKGMPGAHRLMFTTDGSTPPFLEKGFTDYVIRLAIEAGMDPVDAYRAASLNIATYYGLDHELGGIAPGRVADICFLNELADPTPVRVMSDGRITAEQGQLRVAFPEVDWDGYDLMTTPEKGNEPEWIAEPNWFDIESPETEAGDVAFPVIHMLNAVITKHREETVPVTAGRVRLPDNGQDGDYLYISLVDREGKWITNGIVKGFARRIDGLCSTFSSYPGYLVIGRDREAMAMAANRARQHGGGLILIENGEIRFELPLPISYMMSPLPMEELTAETKKFVALLRERGYRFEDPLYSLLFSAALHLPDLRLTYRGLFSVKQQKVVWPSKKLT